MAASFDSLTTPLTTDEVKSSIYTVLGQLGVNTTNWKPSAVTRTIISTFAFILAAFSAFSAQIARCGFLLLSSGEWLKLCAKYVFGVDALEATFATGPVKLTNSGGGVFDIGPNELIVSNANTGKSYRNVEAFSLGAMEQLSVQVIAVEAGADSTSEIGTITNITTPTMPAVLCTNEVRLVGRDDELDQDLKTRSQEKLGALSPNGPWDAYTYTVKSALRDDGSPIGITRVRLIKDGFGNVRVVCATPDGGISSPDIDVAEAAIALNAEPQCVNATAESATVVAVPVTYEAWIYNTVGITEADITAAFYKSLVAFMKQQPIGGNVLNPDDTTGYVFTGSIAGAIQATYPQQVIRVAVSGSDVPLTLTEVPVLTTVTPTIHLVAPPEGQTV